MSQTAAIFAVRSVAGKLARPAARFLNAVAAVRSCGLLAQELPLADSSPFAGLASTAAQPEESSRAAGAAARMDPPRPMQAAPKRPDPAAERRSTSGQPAPPVFSFRRSGVQAAGLAAKPPSGIAPPVIESRQGSASEAPVAAGPPGGKRPGRPSGPLALLDAFTAELLAAPRQSSTEAALVATARPRGNQTGLSAGDRRPGQTSGSLALLDALATELLAAPVAEPMASRMEASPGLSATARPGTPAFDLDQRGVSAAVIDPFPAGPQAGPLSEPSLGGLAAPPSSRSAWPGLSAESASSPRTAAESLAAPARATLSPTASLATVSAAGNLDAETLASMVNEALADQARRHGVDLS